MSVRQTLIARLAALGCIAADEEADMLLEAAGGDTNRLDDMVRRRSTGEPVEWIVGWAPFWGLRVGMVAGVYVPRAQTEAMARRAAVLLPSQGIGVDLATGSGAVAMVLQTAAPEARIVATEVDPIAAACARSNGVEVFEGDLDAPLPAELERCVDVLTANVPYVPTSMIELLPRDVRDHEPRQALDGGADGLDLVRRVIALAPRWLRPETGILLIEISPDQATAFPDADVVVDDEGDVRALEMSAVKRR